jgi:hypothetical protein
LRLDKKKNFDGETFFSLVSRSPLPCGIEEKEKVKEEIILSAIMMVENAVKVVVLDIGECWPAGLGLWTLNFGL